MEYARKHDEGQWGRGRKSKTGAKAALLLSGDDGMVQTALISPLLASIAVAYPDATELMLDQAMSVTAMTMLPAMLRVNDRNEPHAFIQPSIWFFSCSPNR